MSISRSVPIALLAVCFAHPAPFRGALSQVCEANTCEDRNSTQCEIWGEAECANNPGAVMRDCPKTCGVCSNVCTDKEVACNDWPAEDAINQAMLKLKEERGGGKE